MELTIMTISNLSKLNNSKLQKTTKYLQAILKTKQRVSHAN